MEVSGRRSGNDDSISQGLVCHPCQEDGVTQQAHGYCIDCKEYLCETCYQYHRRPKPFKDHVLVDEDIDTYMYQVEKELDETPPPVPERKIIFDTKCSIHRNEDLKYHCRTHKIIVCSVCALKQHKECKNVDYIPEICESEKRLLVQKIEYVEGKVEYILKQDREALQLAEESYETALSAIKTQRCQINRYFEETEKHFSDKMFRFREESKKREEETLGIDQKLKAKKELVSVAKSCSETEKYLSMQKTEAELKNINAKILVFGQPSMTLSYTPKQSLPKLGEAKVEEQLGDPSTRKLKLLRKVNIAGGKEKCSITGGATVSNNGILYAFADRLNGRLVLISEEYDVKFHPCSSNPWAVACISETEVAVTFPEDQKVLFFNIRGSISCTHQKSITVSGLPSGIGYDKSGCSLIISVSEKLSSNLESWSVDGQLLRPIASVDYTISYLTLTAENQILISCKDTKHIVCLLELDGTVLRTFNYVDDNMIGPFGIASDACGNIYVCGKSCLRVVSKQDKWETILHQEDGSDPQAALVCDKTNRLFIGQAQGKMSNYVLVFQL